MNETEHGFVHGGQMVERVRALDWSATPLGPIDRWPQYLRLAVGICLDSGFPIALYLGSAFTLIYNDAWIPIPGDKHPWALGRPAAEVWPEIWDAIGPNFEKVVTTGEAIFAKDARYYLRRHGYTEECYFDYTLGPIRGSDGAIDGIFNAAIETTYRVLGERRTRVLRELAQHIAAAHSAAEACALAAETLGAASADVPFALLYLLAADGRQAELAGVAGIAREMPVSPAIIKLTGTEAGPWPLAAAAGTGEAQWLRELPEQLGRLPGGPWPEPAAQAAVLPIAAAGQGRSSGFLVAGISPRRALDDDYRTFFELAAGQIAGAVTNARAWQAERQRAEALAELDRAKTAFFANVSHEFRTPLTLILGPLEELLAPGRDALPAAIRESLTVIQRNGLRLMRMVNTLLEFSRIEAGRLRAAYAPIDLAAVTTDMVSSFRSACEQAGLRLVVDCPALPEPVYVDRDMWEQIVLNLVSNAFKFTFEGEIEVTLRAAGAQAELAVRDTGIGIDAAELPRIFERFYRVEAARGRSFEGTGIGLALVQELAKLHGGTVEAESVPGQGSRFVVALPFGTAHLPAERIATGDAGRQPAPGKSASPYVEEARQWLARQRKRREGAAAALPAAEADAGDERPQVLVADDNADMREYLRHLLAPHYAVGAVADGEAALAAARCRRPAPGPADVMMPRLDGFGLLRALRAEPGLRTVPVVLLSARAGEESRVEGLEAGADDYLIKPFSARELLARIAVHIELGRLREEVERAAGREEGLSASEAKYRGLLESAPDAMVIVGKDGRIRLVNAQAEALFGYARSELQGQLVEVLVPGALRERHVEHRRGYLADPRPRLMGAAAELFGQRKDGSVFPADISLSPWRGNGELLIIAATRDITERKQAEARIRRLVEANIIGVIFCGTEGQVTEANDAFLRIVGYDRQDLLAGRIDWKAMTPPEYQAADLRSMADILGTGSCAPVEKEYIRRDGSRVPVLVAGALLEGSREQAVAFVLDLTARQQAEAERQARLAAEAANRAKNEFLANMSHELRSPLNTILGFTRLLAREPSLPETARADLGLILKSGEHLHELINDVLDLSKLESGRATLNEVDFDLDFLLEEIEDMFIPAAVDKGLQLVFAPRPDVPHAVRADPLKLRQVLINLIGNALKFTERGSVAVCVEPLAPVAESGPASGAPRFAFTVADSGVGIAREELSKLFAAFGQARAGRHAPEGTGLGLAISRRFVQLMGGEITLDSEPGQGTTVRFEIPLQPVAAPATPGEAIGPRHVVGLAPGQPCYRLLVVDDHAEARELLVRLLAPLGFELKEAADGQAAIDLWRLWQPHLIWMDLRMPVLDGREAARRIRAADQGLQPAIVALTASSLEEERADVLAAGCDELLHKPFREEELFAALEKYLGVRFVYQEEAPPLAPLDAAAAAKLPEAVRTALERAVLELDAAAVELAVDAIRAYDTRLANSLALWAGEFQYDEILSALRGADERAHREKPHEPSK